MGALQVVWASSPISCAALFLLALLYDSLRPQSASAILRFSKRRKALLFLSFVIVLSFVARAVDYLSNRSELDEHALVYDLSEVLYHITILLTLWTTPTPSPFPFLTAWACSFLVEIVIIGLLAAQSKAHPSRRLTISALTSALLLVTTSVAAASCLVSRQSSKMYETEPLLRKHRDSTTSSTITYADNHEDYPTSTVDRSASDQWETESEYSGGSDSDEEDLKEARAQKMQESGLIHYLMSFRVFLPHLIPSRDLKLQFYAVVCLLNIILQRGLHVLHPYLLGSIIDQLATYRTVPWLKIVVWVMVDTIASQLLGIDGVNDVLLARISAWSNKSLEVAAFDKLMSLSMNYHDEKDSGEMTKAIDQAQSLNELFKTLLFEILPCIFDVFIAMWYVNYLLDVYATLIVVAVGIGFTFSTIAVSKRSNESRRDLSAKDREESRVLYESIGNWPTVAYFNRKAFEISRLTKVAKQAAQADVHSNDLYVGMFAAQDTCEQLGRIAALMLAAYRISVGTSTVGNFVALESYWSTVTMPLYTIGHSYRQIATNLIDAERLLQVFETEITVKDKPNASRIELTRGEVQFSDVNFTYEGRQTVIKNLNFTVNSGQTVALVGPTGAGKSTIVKLLMRFYDVDSGKILIDGQDISQVTQDSLRNEFGFVPQDNVLFNTSILENVRYGRLDATEEEVYEACQAACIHDKIMSLPEGYRTRVGERGVKLSGGERQRIAIARVLLKNPRMVLLDEATSAMDSQTEAHIQKALKNLTQGRTSFIIAHRLSTIVDADMILVIADGRVVESGNHEELLASQGTYQELWTKQISKAASTTSAD